MFSRQLAFQMETINRLLILEQELEEIKRKEVSLQAEMQNRGEDDGKQVDQALIRVQSRLNEMREERKVLQKQFEERTEAVILAY